MDPKPNPNSNRKCVLSFICTVVRIKLITHANWHFAAKNIQQFPLVCYWFALSCEQPRLTDRAGRGGYLQDGPAYALWTTRRQTNSPTHQLADRQTRRQSNSPTTQLADNKLADRPTRRQLNWPKKPTRRKWNCHQNRCKIFWTHGRVFLVKLSKKNSRLAAGATAESILACKRG